MHRLAAALLIAFSTLPFNTTSVFGQASDTIVIRVSAPVHPGVATLVEEVELGKQSSAPEDLFTYARVYPGRDGSVWVVDIRDNLARVSAVRQYDRNGRFVRSLGRNGQGPGEYTGAPGDVKELPDGRILLSDARGILTYSANGSSTGRWFAKARAGNAGSPILIDPAGFVITYGQTRANITVPPVPHIYRFRLDGTIVDTTLPPEASFPRPELLARVHIPFIPTYKAAWSPLGYFVTAYLSTYAIDLRRPPQMPRGGMWKPGDSVISIRRSVVAAPVLSEERADWHQCLTLQMRSGSGPSNWVWNGPEIPSTKPPVSDVFVDADARIWVRLSQQARLNATVSVETLVNSGRGSMECQQRWPEPLIYDVLEPSGRYLGQVRLPNGTVSTAITGDSVWAVINDADYVPTVRRYRIVW